MKKLIITTLLLTGCLSQLSPKYAAVKGCNIACTGVKEMTIDKCHDICDLSLTMSEDITPYCYGECEDLVLLGEQKCEKICVESVKKTFDITKDN